MSTPSGRLRFVRTPRAGLDDLAIGLSGLSYRVRPAAVVGALLLAVGCTGKSGAAASSTTRDSAGVMIVESSAPVGPAFSIDSTPAVEIGPAQGSHGEFIYGPVFAVRQRNGRIAANGWATTEFRIFDSTGRWLRTVGRSGGGPGEFEGLGLLFRGNGDSLVTFEPQSRRVQRWTPEGEVIDLNPLLPPSGRLNGWVRGTFDDGALLVATERRDQSGTDIVIPGFVTLFRAAPGNAGRWDSLLAFPGLPWLRHPFHNASLGGMLLFAPAPSYHQRRGRLAFAAGRRFEIEVRSADGKLIRILRRPASPRSISDAELERAIDVALERMDSTMRRAMPERYRATAGRVRPAISQVLVAGDGRIWALFGDAAIGEPITASVFDTLGRWQADVRLPPGLDVDQIDGDGLLATYKDEEGFGRIRFYRFTTGR